MRVYKNIIIEIIATLTRILPFFPGEERVLRLIYNPDKRQNDYLQAIISYGGDLKIAVDTRSFIEWQIFFKGYYEKHVVNLIKNKLPRGGVFIDVGANVGCHSLIASRIASKVIAIEPANMVRKRLLNNIRLNGLNNIIVESAAISDYVGIAPFFLPKSDIANQGTGSLSKRGHGEEKAMISVTTLDELLKNEERIDFIKIDVEGHSKEVILGAKEIIKKFKPLILYEDDNGDEMKIFGNGFLRVKT